MSEPKRIIGWMALFLAAALAVCAALYSPLSGAFAANRVFNGLILAVLLLGIIIAVVQVIALEPASAWISDREHGLPPRRPPRLLTSLARMMSTRESEEGFRISALSMRSLLDGVRSRLDESRDVSRYMVGLLIFLGLLGTFWGLLDTVGGVAHVISGLTASGGDLQQVFDAIKRDLQAPLSGMGTAFSSSLFGLGGALILGVLDLQAGHAQNRFYNRLEEWLAGLARLPGGNGLFEGDQAVPAYIEALLKQTAENLEQLQRTIARSEEDRRATQAHLGRLAEQLAALMDQLRAEQRVTLGLAKNQSELQKAISGLADHLGGAAAGYGEMRDHLRSADLSLARLLEEVTRAREQVPEEVRREVRLLAQSLAREARVRV